VSEEISLKQDEMQMLGTCKWLGPKKYCPEWFYGNIGTMARSENGC
jgi:hypothetical protein